MAVARPVIERLHEQDAGKPLSLAMLQGHQHLYVIELTSPHALSMSRGIGPKEHLTRGACGRQFLHSCRRRTAQSVLKSAPEGSDLKALAGDIAAIRKQGYAVARGEVIPGVVAVAAPYFDRANAVLGPSWFSARKFGYRQ